VLAGIPPCLPGGRVSVYRVFQPAAPCRVPWRTYGIVELSAGPCAMRSSGLCIVRYGKRCVSRKSKHCLTTTSSF
jgi:hypothetical protein